MEQAKPKVKKLQVIHSKKITGVGASGVSFDNIKLPADAERMLGVHVSYSAPNPTVAAAVYNTDNRFAQGRLLVNDQKNLNVPFYLTTYSKLPKNKSAFIPCNIALIPNSYITGFVRVDELPESEPFNLFIHILYQSKNVIQ